MVAARSAALALAVVALAAGGPVDAGPALPCVPVEVAHQGPSCPVPGGWLVLTSAGTTVTTHGPDEARGPPGAETFATAVPPACVDPATTAHGLVVYARPPGVADRAALWTPYLRDWVATANGALVEEAMRSGFRIDHRMACDPDGKVTVRAVVLPTPSTADSFGTIVGDLQAARFESPLAKYWIFYDDAIGIGFAGQATVQYDDRPGAVNANARGPSYAVTYGGNIYTDAHGRGTFQHEAFHNLGAVQLSAPHSTGAFHCNDGLDVMCYRDGGPRSAYLPVCPGVRDLANVDCMNDDYFAPSPLPGSYLATQWNIADPANPFLVRSDLDTGYVEGFLGLG